MGKRYRGLGCVSRLLADNHDKNTCIRVQMKPDLVSFFTKILEAYGHLVFISPVDSRRGIVALWATPDNMPQVREIIKNFPHPVEIIA